MPDAETAHAGDVPEPARNRETDADRCRVSLLRAGASDHEIEEFLSYLNAGIPEDFDSVQHG